MNTEQLLALEELTDGELLRRLVQRGVSKPTASVRHVRQSCELCASQLVQLLDL